jgi:hypothetical protein
MIDSQVITYIKVELVISLEYIFFHVIYVN